MANVSEELPLPRRPSREEWDAILARHLPAVRTFVRLNIDPGLRTKEAVSDIVQSTLHDLLERSDKLRFDGDEAFRAYLWTKVTRKILDKQRYWLAQRRTRAREADVGSEELHLIADQRADGADNPSALAIRGEEVDRVQSAVDQLEALERQIFSMRWIFDIPNARIAAELGMPESTLRGKLGVIGARLAAALGKRR